MSGYATRTRRNADAGSKAPPKVFAREDFDGVRREKKRRAESDAPGDDDGRPLSKSEKRAAKKARKAAKEQLLAQVMGARGTAPASGPSGDDEKTKGSDGPSDTNLNLKEHTRDSSAKNSSGAPSTSRAMETEHPHSKQTQKPKHPSKPKPKKSYGSVELDGLADYMLSLGGAPLAPGWRVEKHVRGTDGSTYHYFFNPQGVKFRSRVEAARHYGLFDTFGAKKQEAASANKTKGKGRAQKPVSTALALVATDPSLGKDDIEMRITDDYDATHTKDKKKKKKKKKKEKKKKDKEKSGKDGEVQDGKEKTSKKKKKSKTRSMESYWEQVKVDGEVFRRGDCAYVISDKTKDLDEDGDEVCAACGTTHGKAGEEGGDDDDEKEPDVMLECDACLRGWHLGCLTPALTEVPKAEWVCPLCLASEDGVAERGDDDVSKRRTACTEFLDGRLHLCRIECIWSEGGEFKFVGRWFATPEETHTGRRSHHTRREVFLTNNTDENNVDSLLKPATVLPPQQFRDAAKAAADAASAARRKASESGGGDAGDDTGNVNDDSSDPMRKHSDSVDAAAVAAAKAAGEDVFLCEYTYDAHFRRFKRRVEWEDDEFSDDEGQGRTGRLARGEEQWLEDDEDDDDDAVEDDGGEWGTDGCGKKTKGKGKGGKGGKKKASNPTNQKRGRAVSRHIAASRRKAAQTNGESGVMGLGAMSVPKVTRATPTTKLGAARVALSLATTPGSLPCRETERGKILDFVEQAINEGAGCRGRCIYISGVPGTGKTATVREVIKTLRKKSRDGYLPRFNHVELNGLRLQTPAHAYSAIAEELLGERLAPQRACDILDQRFKEGRGSDGRVTILVVDEMDLLVTRTQQVRFFFSFLSRKILLALYCVRRVPLCWFFTTSCEEFLTIPIRRTLQYLP